MVMTAPTVIKKITEVARMVLDEGTGRERIAMLYVVPHLANYDMILGLL